VQSLIRILCNILLGYCAIRKNRAICVVLKKLNNRLLNVYSEFNIDHLVLICVEFIGQ